MVKTFCFSAPGLDASEMSESSGRGEYAACLISYKFHKRKRKLNHTLQRWMANRNSLKRDSAFSLDM